MTRFAYYYFEASGELPKQIHCESCHCEFVYVVKRRVKVCVASPYDMFTTRFVNRRGTAKATKRLQRELALPDIVACPECGWYQEHMVRCQARRRLRTVLIIAAILAPLLGLLAFILAPIIENSLGVQCSLALVMVGLVIVAGWYCLAFDPNVHATQGELKERAAASQGIPLTRYHEQLAQQEQLRREPADLSFLDDLNRSDPDLSVKSALLPEESRNQWRRRARRWVLATAMGTSLGMLTDAVLSGVPTEKAIEGMIGCLAGGLFGGFMFYSLAWIYIIPLFVGAAHSGSRRASNIVRPRPPNPYAIATVLAILGVALLAPLGASIHGGPTPLQWLLMLGSGAIMLMFAWFFEYNWGSAVGSENAKKVDEIGPYIRPEDP